MIQNTRRACIYVDRAEHMCAERNQHSGGHRVDLAVRQDSLNGVWISSEKSSRRLNSRTAVEWRAPAKERNSDEAREREKKREREKAKGQKREE